MAGELQIPYVTGRSVYFVLRNSLGQVWNTSSSAFEVYATANLANYKIPGAEQGTASGFFIGNMPSVNAGVYNVLGKDQAGGSPAETDLDIGGEDLFWGGATTGLPTGIQKNVALPAFSFFMVLSSDNATGATGLTVTAQRSLDGAAFANCSNAVTEIGSGWYGINLSASDMNAGVVDLKFTAPTANATSITIRTTP